MGRINCIPRNSLFGVESGVVVVVSGGDDEAAWSAFLPCRFGVAMAAYLWVGGMCR